MRCSHTYYPVAWASVGIYSREVELIPCSPYDFDSYRIAHAYIPTRSQWIMLDPTYSAYITDEDGRILDLMQIRTSLAHLQRLYVNDMSFFIVCSEKQGCSSHSLYLNLLSK